MTTKKKLKSSIERIRRADLVEAAYQTFLEHGLSGMTMARIGERAGMSHGIVNYYFKGKDELLNAVVRRANFEIIADRARLLRAARTPRERLSATVAASFKDDIYTCEIARAWVSYYAAIAKHPTFERLQNTVDRRLASNLQYDLRKLTSSRRSEDTSICVALLIDGLWLRRAKASFGLDSRAAIQIVEDYIEEKLADGN